MMSEKKDDHGPEKKGLVTKLLVIAGIMLAVYIFLIFTGFSVPMIVDGAGQTIGATGKALTRLGAHERTLASGIDEFNDGFREVLMSFLRWALIILLIGLAVKVLLSKKKDDGGHPPGGH